MRREEGRILIVDIGGSRIRVAVEGVRELREAPTGRGFTPEDAVRAIRELAAGWPYERVAIGCPGPVRAHRVAAPPLNLGPGWVGFDFGEALGVPVRLVNDALLQAIGAHRGGRMLFLGLGTGLGTALVTDEMALSLELGQLPWPGGGSFEDRLGARGLASAGREVWLRDLYQAIAWLRCATVAEEVVLGGGNARLVGPPPAGCRIGHPEEDIPAGGIRLWRNELRLA